MKKAITVLLGVITALGSLWLFPGWVYNQFVLGFPKPIEFWNLRFNEIYDFKMGPLEWTDYGNTYYYGDNFGHTIITVVFTVVCILLGFVVLSIADGFLGGGLADSLEKANKRYANERISYTNGEGSLVGFVVATIVGIVTLTYGLTMIPSLIYNVFAEPWVARPIDFWNLRFLELYKIRVGPLVWEDWSYNFGHLFIVLVFLIFTGLLSFVVWNLVYGIMGGNLGRELDKDHSRSEARKKS